MDNQDKNVPTDPFKQDFTPPANNGFQSSGGGPQFGMDDQERGGFRGWLSKYGSSVILPIIALLILAGGIYLYASQRSEDVGLDISQGDKQGQGATLDSEPLTDEQIAAIIGQTQSDDQAPGTSDDNLGSADDLIVIPGEPDIMITEPDIAPKPIMSGDSYSIKAGQGEGVTHLARKVASDYLSENPNSAITNEHRIYIEDYLKDRIGSRLLEVNEEITFDKDMVRQAVEESLQLTDAQLNHLKAYSAHVAF